MTTQLSAFLQASSGSSMDVSQSFSITDATETKYYHPLEFVLDPLEIVTGVLCNITTAKYLMMETNLPVDVTLTTSIGPLDPPTPTSTTFRLQNFMVIGAEIESPIIIYNPNSGTAGNVTITITAVGV